jgi:glutamyl-tRNA reductase
VIKNLHALAFTHHHFDVADIGKLHIPADQLAMRLQAVKESLNISELMMLSTCNRVEFYFVLNELNTGDFFEEFLHQLYPQFSMHDIGFYASKALTFSKIEVARHALRLAASIDSLVVGEREIITQVREAFERSRDLGLAGDTLRLLFRHTIETAKEVYTQTKISTKPVSVVSIAYQQLSSLSIPENARVLAIGAGVTNTAMLRFLKKHGLTNFSIYNRTLAKAEQLAAELNGVAFPLSEIHQHQGGFDILVTCTGSDACLVDEQLFPILLAGEQSPKIVIDLALPGDVNKQVLQQYDTKLISIEVLQKISDANLSDRSQEIIHVEQIIEKALDEYRKIAKMRAIEIAMRPVPEMVKNIRSTAFNEVFKSDLEQLDDSSLEVLQKVVSYMEKKYMSMPMLMAKEIMFKS